MIKAYLLFSLILISVSTRAQDSITVKGLIKDTVGQPIGSVTVSLLNAADSSLVKVAITSSEGQYEFNSIKTGDYILMASAVGYAPIYTKVLELVNGVQIPPMKMESISRSLATVTVVARRPLIEWKTDKMVVNVDAAPSNAANNVLEVLEKSPGISVDRDGNISLKGKQGVVVLLDGKQTYLSGTDLANLLKSMSANQLEQIEIMTQPSAKYDASGNSGIINLRTKKGNSIGLNGNISVSYVQTVYAKSPNSFNFNYRKGKVNFFSSGGYTFWQNKVDIDLRRRFAMTSIPSEFAQMSGQRTRSNNANLRIGADYFLNENTTIGMIVSGTYNNSKDFNSSVGRFVTGFSNAPDSTLEAFSNNGKTFRNVTANINLIHKLNNTGREFRMDVDYIYYGSDLDLYTDNQVKYPSAPTSQHLLRGILPTNINIYTAKVDYTHPLKSNGKLEAGLKTSLINTDNNAPYQTWDWGSGLWIDDVRKDHFVYDENISAAYLNFSTKVGKWGVQTGLRGEFTHSTGSQLLISKSISRNYFYLFPTAYVSYTVNDKNQFGFNYGRRINRPNYQDMNPFQRFLDLFTYNQGNPYLLPQLSNNVELSYTLNGSLNATLNYTYTNGIINDILKQDDVTKVTYQIKENVASNRNMGISVSYNTPVKNWWTVNLYGSGFSNLYKGIINSTDLAVDLYSYMFNFSNQFKFAKTWGAELSGFYQSRSLSTSMFVLEPMYVISFGGSKLVLKNKGTIKLSIVDPFLLQKADVNIRHGNIDMHVGTRWDNRRVGLTFTYRFSKGQSTQQKQSGGAQDEQKRIGSQ